MTRTAVLVTGASRSFGRFLALDFVREVPSGDLDLVRAYVLQCIPLSLFAVRSELTLLLLL